MIQCQSQGLGLAGGGRMPPSVAYVSLAEVSAARPAGLTEAETWALLCQAVQALQDLFLSDGVSGGRYVPVVWPGALLLSARGRVTLVLSRVTAPQHPITSSYAAPELQMHQVHKYSDGDVEKMLVYSVGACLKRLALPNHVAASRLSGELCAILAATSRQLSADRASLMHLLDIISDYSKRREQVKPFSHIVMDLYRETIIYRNSTPIIPDCALQIHKQHMVPPCSDRNDLLIRRVEHIDNCKTIPNKWRHDPEEPAIPKLTRNMFASLEHLNTIQQATITHQQRPKSICTNEEPIEKPIHSRRRYMKRNPVKRAASRLYHVTDDVTRLGTKQKLCIGPEFVIRASLPSKQIVLDDIRMGNAKIVTVIMLNGVKIEINCKPELTTAGQLFEKIIRSEDIEENYFLGLSVLISGDFVFLPSDVKLSKIISGNVSTDTRYTLFVRIRFFLPSLRGIRSQQSRHLLYLQLRRSLLESQLPCTLEQLYELGGLALQAEFGDYTEKHETNHYFLLEHYIPEIIIENLNTDEQFRKILTEVHIQKKGLSVEKAEEDFILLTQSLPNYGVHFYAATLISKNITRDVWLCVSAQGVNLYERSGTIVPYNNPLVYEIFKWQDIQTLCYSKHFLCILPHYTVARKAQPRKYKLKMDHKKSYYTFRLASLHHQFFLRLRTEYSSLQSLSQQFGILLKDIKNEANSLFKFASHTPENQISPNFTSLSNAPNQFENRTSRCKRSKSVHELNYTNLPLEEFQNKENENPKENKDLIEENKIKCERWDKRKGVKMGIRAFTSNGQRMSRSLEAVNAWTNEEQEKISLQSSSRLSNSSSGVAQNADIYVLNSSIKSLDDQFLPDFQETLSHSLMEKLKNLSFADERILKSVTLYKDPQGSLGIQVTEGSDGKVYIQSIVPFGPANDLGNVFKGDQIVSVDGQNLLNLKYSDALQMLKKTNNKVELILSQVSTSHYLQSPKGYGRLNTSRLKVNERDLNCLETADRCDLFNKMFKQDRNDEFVANIYEYSSYNNLENLKSNFHKSYEDFAKDTLPKQLSLNNATYEMSSPALCPRFYTQSDADPALRSCQTSCVSQVALPRSLGLGRRWRGPVRYPVTPIKNPQPPTPLQTSPMNHILNISSVSDEEQIFI